MSLMFQLDVDLTNRHFGVLRFHNITVSRDGTYEVYFSWFNLKYNKARQKRKRDEFTEIECTWTVHQ